MIAAAAIPLPTTSPTVSAIRSGADSYGVVPVTTRRGPLLRRYVPGVERQPGHPGEDPGQQALLERLGGIVLLLVPPRPLHRTGRHRSQRRQDTNGPRPRTSVLWVNPAASAPTVPGPRLMGTTAIEESTAGIGCQPVRKPARQQVGIGVPKRPAGADHICERMPGG